MGGVLEVSVDDLLPPAQMAATPAGATARPMVHLTVRDTGHGMSAAVVQRIFDPFFTTKPPGQGTGLGLAVVHGIVKNHGGAIFVESAPGTGSAFHIHLPVACDLAPGRPRPDETPAGGKGRILLVDDESALVDVAGQMLRRMGYAVTAETSSLEALRIFRSRPEDIDLVITDLTMPGLTGRELVREIAQIRPGLPVIICTGNSENVSEHALRAEGACALLLKPFTLRELADAARAAIGDRDATGLQTAAA